MRLPQMTVGRWMVVVALLALALGVAREAVRLRQLRDDYLRGAAFNAHWEVIYLKTERGWEDDIAVLRGSLRDGDKSAEHRLIEARESIESMRRKALLFGARRRICERLASHPWESVPPDPLEKRQTDQERPPVLIFESTNGETYGFSSRMATRLALAPIVIAFGYVAFRLPKVCYG